MKWFAMNISKFISSLLLLPLLSLLIACGEQNMKPIKTVEYVDLDRFMGDWYVIANIPTFIETDAVNAIETYAMNEDGTIATTFTFHEETPDGERKEYNPTGFIVDKESNALWDMKFIWPFKAEYRVIYLDDEYQVTIIGRSKRDYVWLMAREPTIDNKTFEELLNYLAVQGYDIYKVKKVPQIWTSQPETTELIREVNIQ